MNDLCSWEGLKLHQVQLGWGYVLDTTQLSAIKGLQNGPDVSWVWTERGAKFVEEVRSLHIYSQRDQQLYHVVPNKVCFLWICFKQAVWLSLAQQSVS